MYENKRRILYKIRKEGYHRFDDFDGYVALTGQRDPVAVVKTKYQYCTASIDEDGNASIDSDVSALEALSALDDPTVYAMSKDIRGRSNGFKDEEAAIRERSYEPGLIVVDRNRNVHGGFRTRCPMGLGLSSSGELERAYRAYKEGLVGEHVDPSMVPGEPDQVTVDDTEITVFVAKDPELDIFEAIDKHRVSVYERENPAKQLIKAAQAVDDEEEAEALMDRAMEMMDS